MLTITLSELMSDVQVTQMKSDGTLEESGEARRLRNSLEEMADETKSGNLITECGLPENALGTIPDTLAEKKWSWSEVKVLANSIILALDASLEHALLVIYVLPLSFTRPLYSEQVLGIDIIMWITFLYRLLL